MFSVAMVGRTSRSVFPLPNFQIKFPCLFGLSILIDDERLGHSFYPVRF
jgi:hypothetical protein